jgi:hypothetical protein
MKMKSLFNKKLDKRGVMGLDIAKQFVLGILTLAIIGVICLIILGSLYQSSTTLGGVTQEGIGSILNNATAGITNFYGNTNIWFGLVGIVVIILIMAVVLVVVNRFGGGAGAGDQGV